MENLSVFIIPKSCFLGGVSASNIKNIFRYPAVQPGSFNHESWITLALCPVNGSSAPRCVYKSHLSSVELCDSNVDVRGATQGELPTVKSFSWEFFDGAKRGCKYTNSVSTFDFIGLLTLQMPAHSRSSAMSLYIFCWSQKVLRSLVFVWTIYFPVCSSQKGGADEASIAKTAVHLNKLYLFIYSALVFN